ncbi:MAG: hypothetical protein AB7F36_11445 [Reyranellaceae bacterium]
MIGRDIAAAEHDQRLRETEARMQAEIEREIGVPGSAPRSGRSASHNPSARPDDAMTRQAARQDAPAGARIGFTRPPPQKTLLAQPARRTSTRLPEDGEPQLQAKAQPARDTHAQPDRRQPVGPQTQIRSTSDTISPAGASDGLFGGEDSDAIADQTGDDPAAGDYGRRHYSEKARREANDLRRRILAGEYESFAQAEAEIEARLGDTPEVAQAFKKAARSQFDGEGNWQQRLPGAGRGPNNNMDRLSQRMARGQEIDEQAERDRQLFANVNRSGAMKVERAQQPGWSLWDAGGGAKLALTNNVGRRFALDPKNGVPTLNLLQALIDPQTDPRAWREQALAFLPRRQPTADETWHGMADIDWARLPADPNAVRQLDGQLALLGEGGDRLQAAYTLLPLIGHRVLGPSVLEAGIELIVGLSPLGDIEEVSEASKDFLEASKAGSAVGMALAAGRLMAVAAGYIPGAKLLAAGKRAMRTMGDFGRFAIDPTKAREIVELSSDPRDVAKSVGENSHALVEPERSSRATVDVSAAGSTTSLSDETGHADVSSAPGFRSENPESSGGRSDSRKEDKRTIEHASDESADSQNAGSYNAVQREGDKTSDYAGHEPENREANPATTEKARPVSLNGKLNLKSYPNHDQLTASVDNFSRMTKEEKRRLNIALSRSRGDTSEAFAGRILRQIYPADRFTVLAQLEFIENGVRIAQIDDVVLRTGKFRKEPLGPHSYQVRRNGEVGWIDFVEDLEIMYDYKTGASSLSDGQKIIRARAVKAGRAEAFVESSVRTADIPGEEVLERLQNSDAVRKAGLKLNKDRFLKFYNERAKDMNLAVFLSLAVAVAAESDDGPAPDREV